MRGERARDKDLGITGRQLEIKTLNVSKNDNRVGTEWEGGHEQKQRIARFK